MGRAVWLLLAALGSVCLALECPCNYAANVTWPDAAHCMFFWEGRIWELASWPELALTKDGHFFDPRDGSVDASPPHNFSAASKESLHLAVLARALEGDVDAGVFVVAPNCHALAYPYDKCVVVAKRMGVSAALATLDRKMAALERWTREFRGFGGFLPWFSVNDSVHLVPQTGWEQRVPALDNGEFVWALIACSEALRSVSHPRAPGLQQRVQAYVDMLASNIMSMFYNDSESALRDVSFIRDPHGDPKDPTNYYSPSLGVLDDPYEGELATVFAWLYGNATSSQATRMWVRKRAKLVPVLYRNQCVVQKGWWFSSHEQWKYLFLPYRDVPIQKTLFANGEMARTDASFLRGFPGLFASVNNVTSLADPYDPAYASALGVPALAAQPAGTSTVTPYASFSVMLANASVGWQWYANMVRAPGMATQRGSAEATTVTGGAICPLYTWDAKVTTVVAALGGNVDLCRRYLTRTGRYDAFIAVVQREWTLAFPNVTCALQFALPPGPVPAPHAWPAYC